MPSKSPDLVIRISLVRDGESLQELNPPVFRIFKLSSSINLELLHDKIIAPIMGWERNYHSYFFRSAPPNGSEASAVEIDTGDVKLKLSGSVQDDNGKGKVHISGDQYHGPTLESKRDCIHYVQTNTSASDTIHVGEFVKKDCTRDPEKTSIGDLLKNVGDRCVYNYDLGDCWYHCLEVEKVIPAESEEADGAVVIYDGAMRCPDEDGEGSASYQKEILDLLLKVRKDSNNHTVARTLASKCFDKRHALNSMKPFRPQDFDLSERRVALAEAFGSRNSTKKTKMFKSGPGLGSAGIGQKHIVYRKEDDRFDHMGGFMLFDETINVKPDPKDATLCYNCGTPHDLKACSRCHSAIYCSRACQSSHWEAVHKKKCKKEKAAHDKYCKELNSNIPDPNRLNNNGGVYTYTKYIQGKLRFRVGDYVECMLGKDKWGTGRIVKLYHREPGWPADRQAAPYQIKLDRETANREGISFQRAFIYCLWDHDYQIRKLKMPDEKIGKKGKKKRK